MANLLEKDTCVRGHDVRDKDNAVIIRGDNTVVCVACRNEYVTKIKRRKARQALKARKAEVATTVVPEQPRLSDVVVEIVNILRDNPALEVSTLVSLSKAVRNAK